MIKSLDPSRYVLADGSMKRGDDCPVGSMEKVLC